MRGGRQLWPGDTEEASSSRSRDSARPDAPCMCGSQRRRPVHTLIQRFQPPQGTRPVSVLLQPQVPGSPNIHIWGPTSLHTPAMGRSCPSTLYCSPPTLGPCSVTPARALESSSSFLPSDHALLPALRRAREPRPPLQGRLQSRPPSTSSPLGCSTGRDSSQPGSAWTPLPQGPRARRLGASPVLHTCLQPGHLPNLPLSTHLCVHFLV